MKHLRKIIFFCAIVLPIGLLIPIVLDYLHMSFTVFPSTENLNYIETLTDTVWNGNSSIDDFSYDSKKLLFKYILRKNEHHYPNVFIIFWLDNKKTYLNLSEYTYLTLRIKEADTQDVSIYIKTFEPGVSELNHNNAESLRQNTKMFSLSPLINLYKIDLSEFVTPQWWLEMYDTGRVQIREETFGKVVSFELHFVHVSGEPVKEVVRSLIIEEIAFHRPLRIYSYISGIIFLLNYAFFSIRFVRSIKRRNNSLIEYKQLLFTHFREKDLKKILVYIQQNYDDPGISTIQLQKHTGIPSLRIFKLIKKEYHLSFKQLINKIRIQESKRLLKESDLRIVEISNIVGFNDSSYFNKVFRQFEGITPTEYRDKNK